jgi:hypothetical protein
MSKVSALLACALLALLAPAPTARSAQSADTVAKLDRIADGPSASVDPAVFEELAAAIEADPVRIADTLLPRLSDKSSTEARLTLYTWALGLTRQERAVDELIRVQRESASERVKGNCLRALAAIGGKQAGAHLLAALDAASDPDSRFDLLNLLAQMQYEPALPRTEAVLKLDPRQFYWQSVFVFGKMGDRAVPFLLTKISDKDRNVRANAINVLGQWLIAPEAAKPLEAQFWKEDDRELRGLELSSLEKTIPDLARLKSLFEQVVAREQDAEIVKFARETLEMLGQSKFTAGLKGKQVSAAAFNREYAQLLQSAGKKGDYVALRNASSLADEPKLKALRERILQRDSDEAFDDYQKVNDIMSLNRLAGQ